MSDTAGNASQNPIVVNIHIVQLWLSMLTALQGFISNPQSLQTLGAQAAAAFAITDEQKQAHDQLLAEAQTAQDTINSLASEQATLASIKAANDADYQSKLDDATNFYNGKLSDLQTVQAGIDAANATLLQAQTQLASDQEALASNQAAYATLKAQQDARESSLDQMQTQINQVKAALGATS